ncbi:hypothetical protein BJY16_006770 [Actinoplanes octamycinicus]|uniref:Uncharacterized protein n=1 Tax=Actinoplanes octamycinicus TaxID=135948 RepID=A0A7W7MAV3_9ACTN|nr:hypothetical protein [Actinoplanes octamycinicus]MBB4743311.1 hypothetical protein [Actinoplanes octamycinicus]GIE61827.1 hypothetical protein Aoc01nite_72290 [Actinoplanes octamycinicus]
MSEKPSVVMVAASLLAAGGALFTAEVLLSAKRYFTGMAVYEQAIADGLIRNDMAWSAFGVAAHLVPAAIGVLIGAGLVFLAFFTGLGHNWARAVGWMLGFPVLLWYGVLGVLHAALPSAAGTVDPPELARRLERAWPDWYTTLDVTLMVVVPLVLVTALVCQTVPRADSYFRQPA